MIYFFTIHRTLMTPEQAVGVSMFTGALIIVSFVALSLPFLPSYLRGIARGKGAKALHIDIEGV